MRSSMERALNRGLLRPIAIILVAIACAVAAGQVAAKPSSEEFQITKFAIEPSTLQAGAHADLTTTIDFAHDAEGRTFNDLRSAVTNLPAGFAGNDTAVPACSDSQLLARVPCFPAAAVGTITFDYAGERLTQPLYNMQTTTPGVVAELGYLVEGTIAQHILLKVRPGDLGITAVAPESPPGDARDISVVIWGVPAAHEHDLARQRICNGAACFDLYGGPTPVNIPPVPYLANPTNCEANGGMFKASLEAFSWENPEKRVAAETEIGPIGECDRVPFDPSMEVRPTTSAAESPTGVNVTVSVPQTWEDPNLIATSDLKDATVSLPQGMTINPSAGSGLGACTLQQYESETATSLPGQGCPEDSKIGSVEIETPLLAEKVTGSVYVAKPFENPFGSLLSFYVVARVADRGIVAKVAGEVHLDAVTGQVVTTFDDNPKVPFSRFILKFRPGATAPLVSPPACGAYSVQASFTPWSAPSEPRLVSSQPFDITTGTHESPCPSGGVQPLEPSVVVGTQSNAAGTYSPLYLRIARQDGEQEITRFSTILPPGLTGNLTGIPFCPESAIEAARRATGQQEIASPSCPSASQIGHTLVGAGVGSVLAWTPGKVYLAGPYHGSSLSLVSVTSATVGPFDLGTVVIRFPLRINQLTAQAEIDSTSSDPIPHIIDGIVVHVRDIRAYIDRSGFMLNPTNCSPMSIADTISGAGASIASTADDQTTNVATRFQAADCATLHFKPSFKVSTSSRTSRANGASLDVKLSYPISQSAQANVRSVKVSLSKQLPSRLTTLQKACPDSEFNVNPATCPPESRVGTAIAHTPVLPVPLTGPAYFVSHGGAKFPELVIVLQGYGITVQLHGETFISKKGITTSTFRSIPDVPVGTFELKLPQGHDSALAANGNLCKHKLVMPTALTAQNGVAIHSQTQIRVSGCPKKHKRAKHA